MNYWEILIEALVDNVKDADIRTSIYDRMLSTCDDISIVEISDAVGGDAAFDILAEAWLDDTIDTDEKDEFGVEYDDE